ncbi:transcription factor of the MADS box [Leucoagaricus gongylophorus]
MRKRQRTLEMHPGSTAVTDPHQTGTTVVAPVVDDGFIDDHDAVDSGGEDEDEDDEKPKNDKKAGRRKIKIEYIQEKSRRHITFSKRKAGIMKKAYELSTLTGTQVLLLVVSETGLVYTFTTAKLQPLVTQPEGKNLIQACLNAPHGSLPSSLPVGTTLNRASGPMPPPNPNLPGGLAISPPQAPNPVKDDHLPDPDDDDTAVHGGRPSAGDKRRRRVSSAATNPRSVTSPHTPSASIPPPPPLSIPSSTQPPQPHPTHPAQQQPQIALGSPTSPQQQHTQVTASSPQAYSAGNSYHQHHQATQQQHDMYSGHSLSTGYPYPGIGAPPTQGPPAQQLGGLAAAAAQHGHWAPAPQVQQGGHYARR